jgi:hypothetical protein
VAVFCWGKEDKDMSLIDQVPALKNLDSEQRQYSKSDKVFMYLRRIAPLTAVMVAKGKRRRVTDPKFIDFYNREPKTTGLIQGWSAGAAAALTVGMTTVQCDNGEVEIGDEIRVDCYDANNTNTSNIRQTGEVMRVLAKTTITAGSSYQLTVRRGVGESVTTYNVTADSGNTLAFQTIANSTKENGMPRTPLGYGLDDHYNYTQIQTAPYGVGRRARDSKHWGPDQLTLDQKRALALMALKKEAMNWYGKRDVDEATDGDVTYTGGVLWHLDQTISGIDMTAYSASYDLVTGASGDTAPSRITRPGAAFDRNYWEKFVSRAFEKGNSEKVAFCGLDFLRQLKYAYRDQVRLEPVNFALGGDQNFGITIMLYETQGKLIHFVETPEISKVNPRDLFLLDMEGIEIAEFMPMRIEKNVHQNGYDGEIHQYKEDSGLAMNLMTYHSAMLGMNDCAR